MTDTVTLQTLLELAEAETESAATALGVVNRQLQEHQEKLSMLLRYREEYRERLRHASARGLDGTDLRNFHQFIERLEQAIVQQEHVTAKARVRVEDGQREWQLSQRKYKAFDTLVLRSKAAFRHRDLKKQQKVQDDFASRAHVNGDHWTRR